MNITTDEDVPPLPTPRLALVLWLAAAAAVVSFVRHQRKRS